MNCSTGTSQKFNLEMTLAFIWPLLLTDHFRYFPQSYKETHYWSSFYHCDSLAGPCKFSLWFERFIFWFWERCDPVDRCSASEQYQRRQVCIRWFELWFNSRVSCHRRLRRFSRNPREAESLRLRLCSECEVSMIGIW